MPTSKTKRPLGYPAMPVTAETNGNLVLDQTYLARIAGSSLNFGLVEKTFHPLLHYTASLPYVRG